MVFQLAFQGFLTSWVTRAGWPDGFFDKFIETERDRAQTNVEKRLQFWTLNVIKTHHSRVQPRQRPREQRGQAAKGFELSSTKIHFDNTIFTKTFMVMLCCYLRITHRSRLWFETRLCLYIGDKFLSWRRATRADAVSKWHRACHKNPNVTKRLWSDDIYIVILVIALVFHSTNCQFVQIIIMVARFFKHDDIWASFQIAGLNFEKKENVFNASSWNAR